MLRLSTETRHGTVCQAQLNRANQCAATCVHLTLQSRRAQSLHQAMSSTHACTAQAAKLCSRLQQSFGADSHGNSEAVCSCVEHCSKPMQPAVCTSGLARGTHSAYTGYCSKHCALSRQLPTLAIQMLAIFVKPYTVQPSRSPFLLWIISTKSAGQKVSAMDLHSEAGSNVLKWPPCCSHPDLHATHAAQHSSSMIPEARGPAQQGQQQGVSEGSECCKDTPGGGKV